MKILLVEDDRNLAHMLQEMLKSHRYLVEVAFDGETGLELAVTFKYDLILLDVMLPKQSGIRICQQLRSQQNPVPILLLTALSASDQRVAGLDAGADDYLTKPIDIPELLARIRALLRRGVNTVSPVLEWQGLRLNPATGQVTAQDQPLSLTAKEYALVELFLRNPQRIFSQSALIERLWDAENLPMENAVRSHIKILRKKLKEVGLADILETVFGLGYRLRKTEPDAVQETVADEFRAESSLPQLFNLWQQYRPQYIERTEHLNQAIATLNSDQLDDSALQQAQQQAHTLAGSLGSFGLEQAAELAAQINRQLKLGIQLKRSDQQHLQTLGQKLQQVIQSATEDLAIESMPVNASSYAIRLLIIDDDPALSNQLASLAGPYGIQTQIESNPEHVRGHLDQWSPNIVLLDLNFPDAPEAGFDVLSKLSAQWPQLPIIVFTARDRYSDRVKAAHLGGSIFLHKPVAPSVVIDTVLRTYTQSNPTGIKLLLTTANPHDSKTIESLFTSWGFKWISVKTVQQCWKKLPEFQPDLLLVDADLPKKSSFDLCRVIRNEPSWKHIPVIFMVSSASPEVVQQICEAGGSACIVKPVAETELISRILQRIEIKQIKIEQSAQVKEAMG
jgi:DNA-binding response OmpR family regulator/HPt (histidine-containing phosphotransfer) domain-containing protein